MLKGKRNDRVMNRSGAIAVMFALSMVGLLGMMAVSLDCGALIAESRRAQAVSDSAALAAACDLSYNFGFNNGLDPQGTAQAAGLATASSMGYANDGVVTKVTINIPPLSGDHAFQSGFAEVISSCTHTRAFSLIFGTCPNTVTARSVARGQWQVSTPGLLVLEPTLPASLTVAANSSVVVNAPVIVDSSSPLSTAIALNASVTAPTVSMSGGYVALLNGPINATLQTGVAPTPDPLSYLAPPSVSSLTVQQTSLLTIAGNQGITLQPGVYTGGIRIAGTASVTLAPGTYYMNGGGFTVAAAGSLSGAGVTIINAPILPTDAISIASTGNVSITPPTSGLYQGISVMQFPESLNLPLGINPTMVLGGNSLFAGTFSVGGTIYAPESIMAITVNGNAKVGSQVICRMAEVAGNGQLTINSSQNIGRMPLPVKLVE